MSPLLKIAVVAGAALIAAGAQAQAFPGSKPITLIVPFAAGGPTDKVARDLAEALRKPLGATVVVENAGGAGSTIGTTKAFRAPADGHTLLVTHIGMATTPTLYRNLSYKVDEFEFLGLINEVPMVVVAKPAMAASNFKELQGWIGENKGRINLAHAGLGSASHLCGLMLQNALKTEMTTVPYKGTAPAMTDLIGGQVDLMCDQTTNTTSQVEGKKIKAYAVSTLKRLATPAVYKDLPTLDEAGLKGFNVSIWHGLYAPKGTPAAVVKTLNDALKAALKDPDFIKKEEGLGAIVTSDGRVNPAEHKKFVADEIAKWAPVIKAAGQYAD
ncbi:tripartite tricarboxylate transporter substrate-binding protein [Ottowia sp.]|jgi:tripartite-type tricarboxylate transporter receptor subunit TctC|uniref:tripartite tricarboxylate transporter substrate-binding protein n=1 Tax=Ottowia sp. TaxID=1898956 RepID=UPI0025CC271B|nr:tripartite tricarboxylate transporter substrate-binding protein [Ottowia sp.]MBK6615380.1 tripartite tricarboxylate transporter substrate binding protein BugD [Ottowia sp.]